MDINKLMQAKRLSKYRLAMRSGVPYMTLSDICSGKTNLGKCSAETVYKLARELDVTMEQLVEQFARLPGIGSKLKNVEVDDNALKKPEAIICSMTLKERKNPAILNASRRKRIAAGAGVTVQDVNALIRQFEQMQKMMKQMMGNKRGAIRAMRNMKFPQ